MGIFKQDNKSRNKGSERSSMHRAVCSKCGKPCEVPFKPTGDKPIYCSDCFKNRPNTDSRRGGGRDFRRGGSGDKRMYKAICDKCGKPCEVPFRPTAGKPVYCKDCFGKSDRSSSKNSGQDKEQFEMLNNKLDKILELLASSTPKKETEEKKVTKKETTAKPKKVTKKMAKKPAKKKAKTKKKK